MATVTVQPGNLLQAAVNAAVAGDVINLVSGTYTGGLKFDGKAGITIQGPGNLAGGQIVMSGTNCTLRGCEVTGVRTSWDTGAIKITGKGNTLENVHVHDNESLGIDISGGDATTIIGVKSNHNGNLGLNTGSPATGNRVSGLTIRNSEFRDNNYGMVNPVWKAIQGKTVQGTNGLWYRGAGDAAGGVKICNADDVLIEDCKISGNTGAGLWFDVYCGKKIVRRVESYGQKKIPATNEPNYLSIGIEVELENTGTTLIEDCYAHDNVGSDFAIFEASNVTIRNCQGGNVELRDLGGGREAYRPRNIRIENTKLTRSVTYPNARTQAEVTLVNVQQNLATLPPWTGGTPTPDPVPTETLTDAAGNRWSVSNGKIVLNGTTRQETSGVTEIRLVAGVFFQKAHNQWWSWTGTNWKSEQEPTDPPTGDIVALRAEIALLRTEIIGLKTKVSELGGKLDAIRVAHQQMGAALQ